MFRRNKVETMSVKEFMARKEAPSKPVVTRKQVVRVVVAAGVITLSLAFGDVTMASAGAVNGMVTEKVVNAFTPVIELVKALSYPIALTVMLAGGLFLMVGSQEKGLGMIQRAGFGYIAVQLLPMLMDLLVEIAKAL